MNRFRLVHGTVLFMIFALAGCKVLPPRSPAPVYNDFGPPASSPIQSTAVTLGQVTAPIWLETGKILYRPAKDSTALHSYATQEWIGSPVNLLRQRLLERLSGPRRQGYRLDARLDQFEQEFSRNGTAQAIIVLQARILSPDSRTLASRRFTFSTSTRPNVTGAVEGLSVIARKATKAIVRWANKAVRKSDQKTWNSS